MTQAFYNIPLFDVRQLFIKSIMLFPEKGFAKFAYLSFIELKSSGFIKI